MKRLKTHILVGLCVVLFVPAALAQLNTNDTDLMLVIRRADNSGKNLQVNLGAAAALTNLSGTTLITNYNATQFSNALGASSVGLKFDVFGTDRNGLLLPQSSVWATKPRADATPNSQTAPYARQGQFTMDTASSAFGLVFDNAVTWSGGRSANAVTNSPFVAIIPVGDLLSYNSSAGTSGNFDQAGGFYGGNIEGPITSGGTTNGFSFARSDLYQILPGSGSSQYLGYFDFNSDGTLSFTPASVAAVKPSITLNPVSQTNCAGTTVLFTANATGTPAPTFQWRKGGTDLVGKTNTSLSLVNITNTDAASYVFVASNSAGSATSTVASLTVNIGPAFTLQPLTQTVVAGNNVTLTAAASGTPVPTFQWRKGGTNIANATNSTLNLGLVVATNAGNYDVLAINSCNTVASSNATLTVNVPPSFTQQPTNLTVTAGGGATFSVSVSGTAPIFFQWFKNASNNPISLATNSGFTIAATTNTDAGTYFVVVSNVAGALTSSNATLTVNSASSPPGITSQPLAQTALLGGTANFSMLATGAGPLTFQWFFKSNALSFATNQSLPLSSVQLSNVGTYNVVVANAGGSVTSAVAPLDLLTFSVISNGTVASFVFDGVVGSSNRIDYVDSLTNTNWLVLTNLTLLSNRATALDTNAGAKAARFYRVMPR